MKRILGVVLVVAAAAVPAAAQSFGQSKVHYDDFDFRILSTPHFDIYYDAGEQDAAIDAGRLAERWYTRLSGELDHSFTERQPIVLYASHAQFTETNVIPGILGEGIGGVTEHERGRIVLPFAAGLGETDHVLGHELVHAFQRDILRKRGRSISVMPLWFVEGMAEYLSVGRIDPNTAMWLRDSVERKQLPRIDQLGDPSWFPYRYGQALWAYLAARFGEDIAARVLKSNASGGAASLVAAATATDVPTLSTGWHAWIKEFVATPQRPASAAMTPVVTPANGAGRMNVGPALSPDGRSLAFFSDRDRYSIDVMLADTATGTVRRKIVETAGDPHFESLQFIESAGAWDATGRRFALAALTRGMPVLTIIDVPSGSVEREVPIRNVNQIFSPAWSPDGRRIAISALRNGFSDLYTVDLESADVEPLTSDQYADLQPSWSPDGRTIAFSSDRFSSSLDTLSFGNFRLAAIDVASKAIRELPSLAGAKNIDPHWSADGGSVYFIADGDGISNVYRATVADGHLFQITSVATGISGITSLSPALSLAGEANRLAFSVYRHGAYEIRTMEAGGGTPVPTEADDMRLLADTTNARPAATDTIASRAVAPAAISLPDATEFKIAPYRAHLSLDRTIQPYLTAGGGSTGGFLRAGATLSFGDMLGNHHLETLFQAGKSKDDLAFAAAYLNLRSRWNWGLATNQVTWLTATARSPLAVVGQTFEGHVDTFRQVHRAVSAQAIYPFSRVKRVEITGGVQSIGYDRESTSSVYSRTTGAVVSQTTSVSTAAPTAILSESGAALVYDSSVWGLTSPVLGQRYRIGVAPTFGAATFTTVTADYRRYVMPLRPFTIATRIMHVGRFGEGADDPRLLPLVWTLRDVVRGYGDTGAGITSSPPVTADKILIGNAELRFPVAALFAPNRISGALPFEGLVFADAGRFWLPAISTSHAATLRSAGAGLRVNAGGFIFEFDAVRPFDQPAGGWTFAFNFRPGF